MSPVYWIVNLFDQNFLVNDLAIAASTTIKYNLIQSADFMLNGNIGLRLKHIEMYIVHKDNIALYLKLDKISGNLSKSMNRLYINKEDI